MRTYPVAAGHTDSAHSQHLLMLHTTSSVVYAHVSERAKYLEDRASSCANCYDYLESSTDISICTKDFHVPKFIFHPIANLSVQQGVRQYPEVYSSEGFSTSQRKS